MTSEKSKKPHIRRFITVSAVLALIIVVAPIIYFLVMVVTMFDSDCSEDSRHVALARSLSQDQLAGLNTRIMELNEQYQPYAQLTNHKEPYIPDDLDYLDALYIALGSDYPSIILTKCNVSVGVNLNFGPSGTGRETIELNWYAPTDENPYYTGSETLWTASS